MMYFIFVSILDTFVKKRQLDVPSTERAPNWAHCSFLFASVSGEM